MNKCIFCGNSHNRFKGNSTRLPASYCSTKCIKRMSYCKKNSSSYFMNRKVFNKTQSGIGVKWEIYASKKLGAKHLLFNNGGCDLDWNGKKVDVKACNLYKLKPHYVGQWVFNRNKQKEVDFFFCVALINNKVYKEYLIPSKEFPLKGMTIGWNSRMEKYLYNTIA